MEARASARGGGSERLRRAENARVNARPSLCSAHLPRASLLGGVEGDACRIRVQAYSRPWLHNAHTPSARSYEARTALAHTLLSLAILNHPLSPSPLPFISLNEEADAQACQHNTEVVIVRTSRHIVTPRLLLMIVVSRSQPASLDAFVVSSFVVRWPVFFVRETKHPCARNSALTLCGEGVSSHALR